MQITVDLANFPKEASSFFTKKGNNLPLQSPGASGNRRKEETKKNLGDWQLISEGKGRERQALREEKQQLLPCMGLELIRLGHLSGGGARGELLLGL